MAAALTFGIGQASAAGLVCGETITVNTTLHADLTACPNNGLIIGADNITLNLNGHTIAGDGVPFACPAQTTCDVGVLNGALSGVQGGQGHKGVAIVGGTVRGFGVGVAAEGARNRLGNLLVSHNIEFGIIIESSDSRIEGTSMSDTGTSGLVMVNSQRSVVARDSVSGSRGYAIALFKVDDSAIQRNVMDGNDHGILAQESSRNTIERNSVSHSGGSSIDVGGGAANNVIERNRVADNGDGIVLTKAHDNVISRNVVTGTGFFGFPDAGGFGLILDGSSRTTVDRNVITGGRGPAILVTSLEAPSASADNLLSRNVANSKLSDGILINNGATGTLIERNTANGSGDDGIHVDFPATTLTRNTANNNHDLGIEAVPGVTDGGRNTAAGNGNPAQCTNIAC